ncbi:MAG: rhomboid family intramembrane serine protease [Gemmatimonadaceae bacterium]|nr:rhomboid family intramembrane serine protease [Gemmatimonadaceae bacterium]
MIPISDENPVLHTPVMTYVVLVLIFGTWLVVQGGGLDPVQLATSVCNLGLVPAELTGTRPVGFEVPMGQGLLCVVDAEPINRLTPVTSMFLHGSWGHILGNALFFWVFGNNIEDSMGAVRFVTFYLLCGLAAVAAHIAIHPASPVPTVGASGAISGVLGAYLVLYPRVRVNMLFWFLFFIRVIPLPAWLVLVWWFGIQVITGLPQLSPLRNDVSGGVAVWAHVGGFVAGVVLVKLFESKRRVAARVRAGRSTHVELRG